MTIGERLEDTIKERKLTKYKLAQKLGWSKSTISNYVDGTTVPKGKRLQLLCRGLRINPLWLTTGSGPKDMLIEDENEYDKNLNENVETFKTMVEQWLRELHKMKIKLAGAEKERDESKKELIFRNKEIDELRKANAKLLKEIIRLQKK